MKKIPAFMLEAEGPSGIFGLFEDDGETGYLYLYEPDGAGITTHLHIYDRSDALLVEEKDVVVVWSNDLKKCGVTIWDEMRGIIDLAEKHEVRVWMENRETPGINDAEWLSGF